MSSILDEYAAVAGEDVIHHLQQLTENLRGRQIGRASCRERVCHRV